MIIPICLFRKYDKPKKEEEQVEAYWTETQQALEVRDYIEENHPMFKFLVEESQYNDIRIVAKKEILQLSAVITGESLKYLQIDKDKMYDMIVNNMEKAYETKTGIRIK